MEQLEKDYLTLSVKAAAKKNGMTAPTLYARIKALGITKKGTKRFSGRKIAFDKVEKLVEYKRMAKECVDIYDNNSGFCEIIAGNSWINPLEEHKFYLEHAEEYFEEDFNVCKMVLASLRKQLLEWKRQKKVVDYLNE